MRERKRYAVERSSTLINNLYFLYIMKIIEIITPTNTAITEASLPPMPPWLPELWKNFRIAYKGAIDSKSAIIVRKFFIERHNVLEKGNYISYAQYGLKGRVAGATFRVLQILGYLGLIIEFEANRMFYKQSMKSAENPYGLTEEQYKYLVDHDLGILLTQIASSKLLAYGIRTAFFARWIFRITGAFASVETGGLALPLIIASEVFQTALLTYLNTEKGRKALAAALLVEVGGEEYDVAQVIGYGATSGFELLKKIVVKSLELAVSYQKENDPRRTPNKPPGQDSNSGQGTQGDKSKPADQSAVPEKKAKYSDYTDDPELKAELQKQGL